MRKEPERRYASAQQMASDIQRYLDGRPVIARRDTLSYRTSKFVKRHWLPVTRRGQRGLLVLAFAATTYSAVAAHRRGARSRRAATRTWPNMNGRAPRRYRAFSSICSSCRIPRKTAATRSRPANCWIPAQSACRRACKISRKPRPRLLSTVGTVYDSLGQYQDALPLLDESLQLAGPIARQHRMSIRLLELGRARIGTGDLRGAETSAAGGAASCADRFRREKPGIRSCALDSWNAAISARSIFPKPRNCIIRSLAF